MVGTGLVAVAASSAGLLGFFLSHFGFEYRRAHQRRIAMRVGDGRDDWLDDLDVVGIERAILSYVGNLHRRLANRSTGMLVPAWLRGGLLSGKRAESLLRSSGVAENISLETIGESRVRLGLLGGAAGAVLGACLTNELALLLGLGGVILGLCAPSFALRRVSEERSASCCHELPEFLEVVSLGLRSGLTFDRSFQLYTTHFETGFARSCGLAQRKWAMGLVSREEALLELAGSYDSDTLRRVVDTIGRSMRFGTSLAPELEKAAEDTQAQHRALRQEKVAKAPIRMMIPTATLILPAMLLLVLGPVLLELIEGF